MKKYKLKQSDRPSPIVRFVEIHEPVQQQRIEIDVVKAQERILALNCSQCKHNTFSRKGKCDLQISKEYCKMNREHTKDILQVLQPEQAELEV